MQKLLTFYQQKYSELDIVLTRTVNILTTNKLVKLTTLWTTGLNNWLNMAHENLLLLWFWFLRRLKLNLKTTVYLFVFIFSWQFHSNYQFWYLPSRPLRLTSWSFITFLTMNYLFFSVKENPVITHQWIISFLQMDCFHAFISDWFCDVINSFIEGLGDLSLLKCFKRVQLQRKIFIDMITIWDLHLYQLELQSHGTICSGVQGGASLNSIWNSYASQM